MWLTTLFVILRCQQLALAGGKLIAGRASRFPKTLSCFDTSSGRFQPIPPLGALQQPALVPPRDRAAEGSRTALSSQRPRLPTSMQVPDEPRPATPESGRRPETWLSRPTPSSHSR